MPSADVGRQTRAQILRAAMDIASVKGLSGLSIGELAGRLGMSKSGLFRHFGAKEQLQLATVEAAVSVFEAEVVAPAMAAPPGVDRVRALMHAWVGYLERDVPAAAFSRPRPPTWTHSLATLRETLLVGQVPRGRKEAVAAAVAASLRCPWCVDAHTTMLYAAGQTDTAAAILAGTAPAAGDPNAPYVAWAAGTGTPAGPPAPFGPDVAAEYLGTAVQFHFIARLVLVLLDETFLPGGPRAQQLMRRAGGLVFARKVRAEHRPGRSTRRLEPRTLPDDLAWATPSEPIATAFAALSHHLDTAPHLPPPTRQVVRRVVGSWHGEPMPMSSRWTNEHTAELPADLHAPTRLALLTGLAPHQVTDDDVAAARSLLDTDAALVGALAWAAFTAARRIGTWIGAAAEGQVSRQNPTG